MHPEVCFWAWNGGTPMRDSKKSEAGARERSRLVAPSLRRRRRSTRVRAQLAPRRAPLDDILDAFAALWTAERIARGVACTLPEDPPRDARGLRMEIVY